MGGKSSNAATQPTYSGIQLQTSAEGVCIPIVWGMTRTAPNLIWTGNFQTHKGGSGKKGGKKGCFSGDELVSVPGNKQRRISDLSVGDKVLSYDPVSEDLCIGTIAETHVHPVAETGDRFLRVTLANGTVLKPTSNHYFWRRDGRRIEVVDYLPGFDTMIDEDGRDIEIVSIEPTPREAFSYNLTVTPHHNFFVKRILAHNGKKGGGQKGPTYSAGVILALCEGPIHDISAVYKNSSTTNLASLGLSLHTGTAEQGATPFVTDIGYADTAYVATMNYDLGAAPQLPQHNFEINGIFCGTTIGTPDVNPALVINDLLTNPQYGLGIPSEAIGDMGPYSAYCQAMGLLFSPGLTTQEQAISILQRWAQITNTWIFWSEDQIKFVPLGDTAVSAASVGPIATSTLILPGQDYQPNDIVSIPGGTGGTARILTVNTSTGDGDPPLGAVLTYQIEDAGTGYSFASNVSVTGGSGSGMVINVYRPGVDINNPEASSFTPNLTPLYDLTYDDFVANPDDPPVTVTRMDPADSYNWVRVTVSDRGKAYNQSVVEYKDQTSIELYGLLQSQDVQAKEVCDTSIGRIIAQIVGKRATNIRNTYAFRLPYNFVLLEPGDVVTLTDPYLGLDRFPVRIQSLAESEDGLLSFVAEECPAGIGTPASFTTAQEWLGTAPPPIDIEPGAVNPPAIIEPVASVTGGTAQVWIGLSSSSETWGGALVYVSVDDVTYTLLGTVIAPTPQGVLLATLASHADPDGTNTLSVDMAESHQQLTSAITPLDADAGRSMVLVDAELIGVGAAVPNGASSYAYDLTYLRRGMYGTPIASHAAASPVATVNPGTMLQVALPKAYVGQTLYLKFPSFNISGAANEDISDVTRYTYVPAGVVFTIAPPGTPTLALTTGAAVSIAITATWTASAGPNLGSYEVQWSEDGGSTWSGPDVVVGAAALTYTLSPATPSTSYATRVRAISGDGQAASNWVPSASLNSGAAPVVPQPLVNGDIPIGLMVDPTGAMILVAQ